MPFMAGDDACETLVEDVVALGDESSWCGASRVSMPFICGSCENAEPAVWSEKSLSIAFAKASDEERDADTTSMGETSAEGMGMAREPG